MSAQMGKLIPFLCREILPGDRFSVQSDFFLRFAPMLAPIMHRVNVHTHYFFVPNRLVWDEWKDFITGGQDGTLQPAKPYLNIPDLDGVFGVNTLMDYMGLPVPVPGDPNPYTEDVKIDALPFRAYQLIYNEYYRDQNCEDPVEFSIGSGKVTEADAERILSLRNRCWEKDYFTSALPWTQRGQEVNIPLAGDAPIKLNPDAGVQTPVYKNADGSVFSGHAGAMSLTNGGIVQAADGAYPQRLDPNGTLIADLTGASTVTINDLRRSVALQSWLENNAVGGSRYVEQLLAHFGVRSSDARLQRPEFLGGGMSPAVFSEVLQTSETAETPQANMAGHGVAGGSHHGFNRFFEEHGWLIAVFSVTPRSNYSQGIERQFTKFDKLDYAFPEFAHLGEQPIYNRELYLGTDGLNDDVFGYTPRYAEYKYIPSRVAGNFRADLSFWHLGRIFTGRPNLNEDFVHIHPTDTSRIFAVTDSEAEQLYVQIVNRVHARRVLPRFGVPRLKG